MDYEQELRDLLGLSGVSAEEFTMDDVISNVKTLVTDSRDKDDLEREAEILRDDNRALADEVKALRFCVPSSAASTAIRTHLSNQRAALRAKLPRAWNKIQAQHIEREIKEIDQLLGVLRSV